MAKKPPAFGIEVPADLPDTAADKIMVGLCSAAAIPPSQRTTQPISSKMEQLLLHCLEKNPDSRPSSAGELKARLLATPAAADWTATARLAWWDDYERQPVVGHEESAGQSMPMATVRIDLGSRME